MRRIRKWPAIVALIAAAVVWFFHATFLQGLAAPLIADAPDDSFQYVGIIERDNAPDGDWCFDEAARLAREKPQCHILLIESGRTRLVEIGVLPSFESLCRDELETQGVPPQDISVVHGDGYDDWSTARAIRTWLADHPNATLLVLCGRFHSAHFQHALDTTLDTGRAACVCVRGLHNRRYDETDWWKSRTGIKAFGYGWLRYLHGWLANRNQQPPVHRNADDYERECLKSPLPPGEG